MKIDAICPVCEKTHEVSFVLPKDLTLEYIPVFMAKYCENVSLEQLNEAEAICYDAFDRIERYRKALEQISNMTLDMPAAWQDELDWYKDRAYKPIAIATKALKEE